MKTYNKVIAMVAAGLTCSAITSEASLVTISPPVSSLSIASTSYTVGGTATQVGQLVAPYNSGGGDIGSLTSTVYSGDANNTLGGLTFVFTETLTSGLFQELSLGGFSGTIAVGLLSGAIAGDSVTFSGGVLHFNLDSDVTAPTTLQFVVDTSSPIFGNAFGSVQDGESANVPNLAPVPEPATVAAGALMLLPFGIGALLSLRKDRVA